MIQEWTPESIRQALVEEIGSGGWPVEHLDWWARSEGIKIGVLFHVLASSPEFVYREWTEGRGDWAWTLADKPEPKPEPHCDGKVVYATGACRSSEGEETRFELISPIAMEWIASAAADPSCRTLSRNDIRDPRLLVAGAIDEIYEFLSGGDTDDPDTEWVKCLAYAALYALKAAHVERGGDPAFHENCVAQDQEIADMGIPRFDLLPPRGLMAVAETYREGAVRRGCHNWEFGMVVPDVLNRALRHFEMWLDMDRSDPHLGHAIWNIFAGIHSLVMWPELNRGKIRKRGCIAPFLPGADAKVDAWSVFGQARPMIETRVNEMVQDGTAIS